MLFLMLHGSYQPVRIKVNDFQDSEIRYVNIIGYFTGYWTGGRDSHTPSQFSWDHAGGIPLNPQFTVFAGYPFMSTSTCVGYSPVFKTLWSAPCNVNKLPLCEFIHGM